MCFLKPESKWESVYSVCALFTRRSGTYVLTKFEYQSQQTKTDDGIYGRTNLDRMQTKFHLQSQRWTLFSCASFSNCDALQLVQSKWSWFGWPYKNLRSTLVAAKIRRPTKTTDNHETIYVYLISEWMEHSQLFVCINYKMNRSKAQPWIWFLWLFPTKKKSVFN